MVTVFWPGVVFLVAIGSYLTPAAYLLTAFGIAPTGFAWYAFFAEVVGSMFHARHAKKSTVDELKERVDKLEKRLGRMGNVNQSTVTAVAQGVKYLKERVDGIYLV